MHHFDELAQAIQAYHPTPDLELLRRAYDYAREKHHGQVWPSGEEAFSHLFCTALLVCKLRLDVSSVTAALLHDMIDVCHVSREELSLAFNSEIADLVEGITKLTRVEFDGREEKQAENFRRMLVSMAKDIRVVLVKLCDRLHVMRTLQFLPEEKRRQIASETKDIYSLLANRLGIFWLKSELEDLSFLYLKPEAYELVRSGYDKLSREKSGYIERTCHEILSRLEEAGISGSVKGRAKHYNSIWHKMERDHLAFDEVHDILGFRVLVPTVRACYEALGVVHAAWKPIPGRFKDYIAMPKPNMYQSLHSTVIGPEGQRIEIQIRTHEMNRIAEEGIAAHWKYKEGSADSSTFDLQWVRELVDTQAYLKSPDEFMQSVKSEFFPEEVFVFTPKGDLIRLSYNSTPIDFAYSVHSDVGHHTTGARVNGQIVPLSHRLENGDTVEVFTAKNHVPSKDWLKFVGSNKAKQRIRAFLKTQERTQSLAVGIEILTKDLRKVRLSLKKLEQNGKMLEVAQGLGLKTEADLYAEIGYGKIGSAKVLAKVLPEETDIEGKLREQTSPLQRIFQRAASASQAKMGVKVSGIDDIVLRFAKCCQPLPGDRIIGFITRGRGVVVHHADCSQILQADPLRRVEVAWDSGAKNTSLISLRVYSQDQKGLLANVTKAITDHGANINNAQIKTSEFGKTVSTFELTVESSHQLDRVKRSMELVVGVIKVERINKFNETLVQNEESPGKVASDRKKKE